MNPMRTTLAAASASLALACAAQEPADEAPALPTPHAVVAEEPEPTGVVVGPFFTRDVDGRRWVLRVGSPELEAFLETGEPASSVTLVGAGPGGITLRGTDRETLLSYAFHKPGYFTQMVDGRLWVFEEDSEALEQFLAVGDPAKSVTLVGAGPDGITLRGPDKETLQGYLES